MIICTFREVQSKIPPTKEQALLNTVNTNTDHKASNTNPDQQFKHLREGQFLQSTFNARRLSISLILRTKNNYIIYYSHSKAHCF